MTSRAKRLTLTIGVAALVAVGVGSVLAPDAAAKPNKSPKPPTAPDTVDWAYLPFTSDYGGYSLEVRNNSSGEICGLRINVIRYGAWPPLTGQCGVPDGWWGDVASPLLFEAGTDNKKSAIGAGETNWFNLGVWTYMWGTTFPTWIVVEWETLDKRGSTRDTGVLLCGSAKQTI